MSEKLIIKNFGPIKSAEIEMKRFTVLIGEQATGKSTIAKLLAVCRYFSYIVEYPGTNPFNIGHDSEEIVNIKSPFLSFESPFEKGLDSWGLTEYVDKNSYIKYECPNYVFIAEAKVLVPSSGGVFNLIQNIEPKSDIFKQLREDFFEYNTSVPPSFYLNNVSAVMDNPFFLPVERGLQSIFSLGKTSIQNISDSLFNQFTKLDQVSKTFIDETTIEPLKISYKNLRGNGLIKKDKEDRFYRLNNAASGYQTAIPVVLACKYYHERRKKNKTFVVEEPELSLFPTAQKDLMYYLVQEINKYQSKLLLTTHSPYTLTSLNNLMLAHKVGQDKKDDVNKIIPEANWLNSDDVSAYMLKSDGTVEDILDRESSLIEADKIDEVSSVLNLEFDELLSLEFGDK